MSTLISIFNKPDDPQLINLPGVIQKDTSLLNWEAAQEADKLEAAKIAAAKLEADTKAEEKATLLAKRRRPSKRYYTEGGAAGLLGQAPVNLKTLLGE